MVRNTLPILAVLLTVCVTGTDARAQFRSAPTDERNTRHQTARRHDPAKSLAPTPLYKHRALDDYVHNAPRRLAPLTASIKHPTRRGYALTPTQNLLWGSVGLVVHVLCDPHAREEERFISTVPYRRDLGQKTCIACEKVGTRAIDALSEGLFSRTE